MDSVDLIYLKMVLAVVCAVVIMMVGVLGNVAYYGVKIGFLFKNENKVQKKRPPKK